MTTEHREFIRDAFQGDLLGGTDRERLWAATQQRITRQARARLVLRAGLLLLAGLVIAAAVLVLSAIRSPSDARLAGAISMADSIMISTDSVERSMTQVQEQASNDLIPLLGHRSGLQTDLRHLESRQLELSQAVERASGRERNAMENQLKSIEQQIEATRVAIAAIDARLSGQPTVPAVPTVPPEPFAWGEPPQVFQFGSASSPEMLWAAGGVGTFLVLGMVVMMGYMRRIARTTRQALSALETQVSSQHTTLAAGIDAIAVEVERLGEGQRFMSKVLSSPETKVSVPKGS